MTLNDVIPGEKETSFRVELLEKEDNYTFSGETVSAAGATVTYTGAITPKTMKLDLNVTMPQSQWMNSYLLSELTRGRGKDVVRNQETGQYEWGEADNQLLTAALYTDMDLEMVKDAGSLYATVSTLIKGMGGYLLPQLLGISIWNPTETSLPNIRLTKCNWENRSSVKSIWTTLNRCSKSACSS